MRWLALVMALSACGSDDSGGGSSATAPTIKTNTVVVGTCATGGCLVAAAVAASDPEFDKTKFAVVYTWSLGVVAPACTMDNTADITETMNFSFPTVGYDMTVTGRACVLTLNSGTFDAGVEASAVTPSN